MQLHAHASLPPTTSNEETVLQDFLIILKQLPENFEEISTLIINIKYSLLKYKQRALIQQELKNTML